MAVDTEVGRDEEQASPGGHRVSVVGIGASAGGLESLEALFRGLPAGLGYAYVVVQHLSPDYRSMMVELLGRTTSIPVRHAEDAVRLDSDTVTVVPPGKYLTVVGGHLVLSDKPPAPTLTYPIDRFLASLADDLPDDAIAVILSGTGRDGGDGARRIRVAGGVVIAESPETARFDGMPRNVIEAGLADAVLPAARIGEYLARLRRGEGSRGEALVEPDRAGDGASLHRMLDLLRQGTGVDFSHYKSATVRRRLRRRMDMNGIDRFDDYVDYVATHDTERELLFRDLLIKVTGFFRDEEVWRTLAGDVLPELIGEAPLDEQFRVWVPGCATGEEAYTLAMLVLEEMTRRDRHLDVKVYATDIDREALETASAGRYGESQIAGVDPERRAKWFTASDRTWVVSNAVRRLVTFVHHNVTRDPPFSKVALVSCRNLLIYLDNELQAQAMAAFRFALKPRGALVLGMSESADARFAVHDPHGRIYRPAESLGSSFWMRDERSPAPKGVPSVVPASSTVGQRRLLVLDALDAVLAAWRRCGVLVESDGTVCHVFGDVGPVLRVPAGSVTTDVRDLARVEIAASLTAALGQAAATGQSASFDVVRDARCWTTTVLPLRSEGGARPVGSVVLFASDEPDAARPDGRSGLQAQLDELQAQLARARRERGILVEQLETSNEELQSTNEELVAANEELQSTNEELQSVNEELHTVNAENNRRIDELEVLQRDMDHLLAATDVGTLVVDDECVIRRYSRAVADFLPILERDLGRPMSDLASTVGGRELTDEIRHVLDTGERRERTIDSPHGPVLVRTLPYHVRNMHGVLATFVDVSTIKRSYELSRRVVDALPAQVAFVDREGTVTMVNEAWRRFGRDNGAQEGLAGVGRNYFDVCGRESSAVADGIRRVLEDRTGIFTHVYPCHSPAGEERWFVMQCCPAGEDEAVVVHFDITAQKRAEQALLALATQDPLTAVLNRRGVEAELDGILRRTRRSGRAACAVLIDCDDFKVVNDRVGLAGGDSVLRTVARRLEVSLRAGDLLSRVGGDEFLVVMPEASISDARAMAERLRLAVGCEPVALSHGDVSLTISLAAIELDADVYTLEHVLDRSRDALLASKRGGKNRVSGGVRPAHETGRRAEVKAWLRSDDIGVAAQPIVVTATGATVGYEFLARSPTAERQSPLTMFRMAMEEGLLSAVDEHVFTRMVAATSRLPEPGRCHVNLYPSTLLSLSPGRIREIVAAASPCASPLVVELSEQQVIGDPADLLENLRCLREAGVLIALDDVGAGRTSLETLVVLEPEIVKLDARMIRSIDTNKTRMRWLQRIVDVAHRVGATTVAEGVETYGEMRVVETLNVQMCQGYFTGRPELLPQAA